MKEVDSVQQHVSSVSVSREGVAGQAVTSQTLISSEYDDEHKLVEMRDWLIKHYPLEADWIAELADAEIRICYRQKLFGKTKKKFSKAPSPEEVFGPAVRDLKAGKVGRAKFLPLSDGKFE